MIAGIADTDAVLWQMYGDRRLSVRARAFIEDAAGRGDRIGISAISLAAVVYLVEKGRVLATAYHDLVAVLDDVEQVFEVVAWTQKMVESMRTVSRDQIPDLPDRIVAATAVHLGIPLISCDERIQASAVASVW